MPETGADAKGFQDSAVQSVSEPATEGGDVGLAQPGSQPGDEPDRVAIVGLADQLEQFKVGSSQCAEAFGGGGDAMLAQPADAAYPDFPETNPFRLAAAGDAPTGVRRREPAPCLARRRGSASELKVVIPPLSSTGVGSSQATSPQQRQRHRLSSQPDSSEMGCRSTSGSALVAQRAVRLQSDASVVGDRQAETAAAAACGPHLERRDSIWDRLPPSDLAVPHPSDQQGSAARLLRSPFSLGLAAPTPDQTNDEGQELFLEFVRDRIEEDIQGDEVALRVQQDDYFNRIMSLPGLSNPVWARTGSELRELADAFATSHQRQELRCKAQQTDLTVISWDRFRQLLEELFSGEAGVTQERILVLFFFLSDCVVATIRRHAWDHLRRLIKWSLRYIVERVCFLVQQAGGWGVVLRQSAEYVYMTLKIVAFSLVCVAAGVYIYKSSR